MSMRSGHRLVLAAIAVMLVATACGGNGGGDNDAGSASPTVSVTAGATGPAGEETTPQPISQLKVAFINLYSPLTFDRNDQVASQTFNARLDELASQLKELDPDIIAFNEASVTQAGNAIERLVADLKMEFAWGQANPGFGLEGDDADAAGKQQGFREGELLFSRFPILESKRLFLNPRSSELGEGRVVLFAQIKAPAPLGEFNVALTHLTGGGEAVRTAQAQDLIRQIGPLRGARPTLLIGDMGDPAGSATYQVFTQAGFADPAWESPLVTCCRQTVLGDQPPLQSRPDCVMAAGFPAATAKLFADQPVAQPDGEKLYASDHNGLVVVFPLEGG